ncbi:MAG: hypothetical protein IJ343_08550 [Clostridia bacterium]|nr:hypothetical protein [Clostridia bacterium]
MNEQQEKAAFRTAIDHTLTSLKGDPFLYQRVTVQSEKGEDLVKKRFVKTFVIVMLAVLCMSTVALAAVMLNYSPQVRVRKQAMQALHDTYGLSRSSLGLFSVELVEDETGVHAWYRAHSFLPTDRVGDYHVLIAGEDVSVSWTHDDKDPALWLSGDPKSPYWGEKQLQTYLTKGIGERDVWLQQFLKEDVKEPDELSIYGTLSFVAVQAEAGDMPFREAQALADTALMDFYGLTETEVARYDHYIDPRILLCDDGRRLWEITIADLETVFNVLVDASTGEIVHIVHLTGGNG